MGITNVYANPEETYSIIEYNGEQWIVAKPMIEKLRYQEFAVKEVDSISGQELVGKHVETFSGDSILVLPATFLDSNYGTGMVHAVPSDSADDLIALRNLQENNKVIEKYDLDKEEVQAIQPIEIFDTPDIGTNSADYFLKKYKVTSQNDRKKLDAIKKELYTITLAKGVFGSKYKTGFSQNLQGMIVSKGQSIIKKDLLDKGSIHLYYELTGPVVSRGLTPCVVKIVSDQWFVDYDNSEWKQKTHQALKKMKLYPEKSRAQFEYVIDWLHEWACTREEGLGTRLPWDEKWLIESLSDSTIYKAYYTFSHLIKDENSDNIDNNLFDYVLLGKNTPINISKEKADEMRKEFLYWFPCDFRNSGKDLIQNHLTFYIFNHVAIFGEEHWPKGIGTNGWVTRETNHLSTRFSSVRPLL